jgi:hypothetical protein
MSDEELARAAAAIRRGAEQVRAIREEMLSRMEREEFEQTVQAFRERYEGLAPKAETQIQDDPQQWFMSSQVNLDDWTYELPRMETKGFVGHRWSGDPEPDVVVEGHSDAG